MYNCHVLLIFWMMEIVSRPGEIFLILFYETKTLETYLPHEQNVKTSEPMLCEFSCPRYLEFRLSYELPGI